MRVAVLLLAIIPILSLVFVLITLVWPSADHTAYSRLLIILIAVFIGVTGCTLLSKHPRNMESLRLYLREISEGDLPEEVILPEPDDDVRAIEGYLNTILQDLRAQVRQLQNQLTLSKKMQETISAQAEELVDAERQRVMLESLGAACHHIAQPASVLRITLDKIKQSLDDDQLCAQVDQCLQASDGIADVLNKLRSVSEYRTVPYKSFHSELAGGAVERRILNIESAPQKKETDES